MATELGTRRGEPLRRGEGAQGRKARRSRSPDADGGLFTALVPDSTTTTTRTESSPDLWSASGLGPAAIHGRSGVLEISDPHQVGGVAVVPRRDWRKPGVTVALPALGLRRHPGWTIRGPDRRRAAGLNAAVPGRAQEGKVMSRLAVAL